MAKRVRSPEFQTARARSLISIFSILVLAGIGIAATGDALVGAWLTLPSLVVLIYALHRFGRSGPDAPIEF